MTGMQNTKHKYPDWSEEEIAELVRRYPHERTDAIASDLGRTVAAVHARKKKLGLKKSVEFIRMLLTGPGSVKETGAAHRFTKGHAQSVGAAPGAATRFTSGRRAHNVKPAGSTRLHPDGYVMVKTEEGGRYELLQRVRWREHHGEDPPKGFVIGFHDGDRTNCEPENLYLTTRSEQMRRNTIARYPGPLRAVMRLTTQLQRKIDELEDREKH